MKKTRLLLVICSGLLILSCKQSSNNLHAKLNPIDTTKPTDEIIIATAKDKKGTLLKMQFNNTKYTATLILNTDTIEMQGQPVASGMSYKNAHYEFKGKGQKVTLTKDGKPIFSN